MANYERVFSVKDSPTQFPLGQVVATPGVIEHYGLHDEHGDHEGVLEGHLQVLGLVARHAKLDQGQLDDEDQATNERAVEHGGRIFSSFQADTGPRNRERVWVITESDRSVTTVLLPSEY